MTLKYIFVIGDKRLPGYGHLYSFGHLPLDDIIIKRLQSRGLPNLSSRWSRLNDYKEYLVIQKWVRDFFIGSIPLAVEFHLWQEENPDSIGKL
jgi:hypothetical protein